MTDDKITPENLVLNPSFKKWVLSNGGEERHWAEWCEKNAAYSEIVEEARQMVRFLSAQDRTVDGATVLQEWGRLDAQIIKERHADRTLPRRRIHLTYWHYASMAASVVFFIGIFFFMQDQPAIEPQAVTAFLQKSTPSGQKLTVHLSDGTVVKLNAESSLRYQENFDGDQRQVYLEGEAYFEVARDESRPFLIHTGNIVTQVLGTSFNVRAYANDDQVQVVVNSGKVSVEKVDSTGHGEKAILLPMEMVTYHPSGEMVKEKVDDPACYLSWKENIIYLRNAQWPEIQATLERWYGEKIKVSGKPDMEEGYTGTFKELPLESVLDRMSYSLNFTYKLGKHNEEVLIMFKK